MNYKYVSKDFHMSVLKDKDILKVKILKNILLNTNNETDNGKLKILIYHFLVKCNSAFHFYVYANFIWILLIK